MSGRSISLLPRHGNSWLHRSHASPKLAGRGSLRKENSIMEASHLDRCVLAYEQNRHSLTRCVALDRPSGARLGHG